MSNECISTNCALTGAYKMPTMGSTLEYMQMMQRNFSCNQIFYFVALAHVPNLGGGVEAGVEFKDISTPLYPLNYPGGLEILWIVQSKGMSVITLQVSSKLYSVGEYLEAFL